MGSEVYVEEERNELAEDVHHLLLRSSLMNIIDGGTITQEDQNLHL